MMGILASITRFLAMHLPLQSMRIAMYRSAGIRIGNVSEFGGNIWISINYKNLVNIEDGVILAGYVTILSHSFLFARARDPEDYYAEKDGFFQ